MMDIICGIYVDEYSYTHILIVSEFQERGTNFVINII